MFYNFELFKRSLDDKLLVQAKFECLACDFCIFFEGEK